MDTVTPAFDSTSMPLSEPAANAAFWLWRWIGQRMPRLRAQQEANALRIHAHGLVAMDSRLAADLRAAADWPERRHGR
jgi:hypothetical protein